jgi:tetratricopeptide (TPR) repeat protein
MKLSSRNSIHRLLFGAALCLLVASAASFADQITLKDGRTQATKIMGMAGASVLVQVGAGTAGIPLASVAKVTMTPPADFTAGMQAFQSKDYPKAVSSLAFATAKYRGLPADWVQQGMRTIGDAYLAMNDFKNAEAAYVALKKVYPETGLLVNVGLARIDFAKKNYAEARQKLEPIAEKALKEKTVPPDFASAYSETFCLLGQIEEQAGNDSAALENYLRTVTLYYKDSIALNTAQSRADALKERHVVVP